MKFNLKSLSITFLLAIAIESQAARADDIIFIVNTANPATQISESELANYFMKRKREWPDGTPIRFIDRKEGSSERRTFLAGYLGKSGRDVELYWIGQKLYSGDAAPMQVESDTSVISLISNLRGAVGYVTSEVPLTSSIKKLEVLR